MITKKMFAIGAIALGTLGITSCSNDDDGPARADLKLTLNNLEPLQNGFQYEGWIIVDAQPISTGKFNDVSANKSKTFSVVAEDLEKATSFVLSIEPKDDSDTAPSNTKILSGEFVGNAAQLNSVQELGNLSTSEGRFTLSTPTDGSDNGNDQFGVWFEVAGAAGLKLPTLPAGWKYEGWVMFDDVPVSTFKFTKVDEADEFNSYSGQEVKPMFPGEDFLNNSIAPEGVTFPGDVRGKTVVISVEPEPDDDSKVPFSIKPLILQGSSTNGTLVPNINVTNSMTLNSATLPIGFVTK